MCNLLARDTAQIVSGRRRAPRCITALYHGALHDASRAWHRTARLRGSSPHQHQPSSDVAYRHQSRGHVVHAMSVPRHCGHAGPIQSTNPAPTI